MILRITVFFFYIRYIIVQVFKQYEQYVYIKYIVSSCC